MKTAILAILLVGCGGGDFTSTGATETGGSSPMGETMPTETGGMPTASPNVAGAPTVQVTGTGGMLGTGGTSSAGGVTAAGGMVVTSSGGSENLAGSTSTGGIPSAGGETGSGGIPSANGGNTAIGTGGIPMAAGGSTMVETGGTTSTGGTTGIDNHCPLTADTGLACEPGQYVRSCVNGMAEVRVSLTWSSDQVMKVTSDSPFGCQVATTDAIGYHVRTVCLGAPVTFTLPQVW